MQNFDIFISEKEREEMEEKERANIKPIPSGNGSFTKDEINEAFEEMYQTEWRFMA